MAQRRHTQAHTHMHKPPPKAQGHQESHSREQFLEFWVPACYSRHFCWGLERDRTRAICPATHQESILVLQTQGQYSCCTTASLVNTRQAQLCSPRGVCARVWASDATDEYCQFQYWLCLLLLGCHMRTCLSFSNCDLPIHIVTLKHTNYNSIPKFRSFCFYNTYFYLFFKFILFFEIGSCPAHAGVQLAL